MPEKFTPLAPITAPVMGMPAEYQGIHPQLSRLQESGQSPPGAPKEGNLQVPGKVGHSPATSNLPSRKTTRLLRFLLLGSCRGLMLLPSPYKASLPEHYRSCQVGKLTLGYGWERVRENRQAVSLLGVENPRTPGALSQSEDDSLTLCFWIFSGFVKG